MRTRLPIPIASAPPLPPSPVTTATIGVRSAAIARRFRAVASVEPVAVELDEVLEEELDEVARVRAPGVAGELRPLPGRQARVGLLALSQEPLLELRDLVADPRRVLFGLERRDPVLQLEQRCLEVKRVRHT